LRSLLYYLRVFFISFEFLVIITSYFILTHQSEKISLFLRASSFNPQALQWLALYPLGLAAWVFQSGSRVLFPSETADKILHEWPDYWKLKAHFNIGIIYSIFWAVSAATPWALGYFYTAYGAIFLAASILGASISALSFYQANLTIREILIKI